MASSKNLRTKLVLGSNKHYRVEASKDGPCLGSSASSGWSHSCVLLPVRTIWNADSFFLKLFLLFFLRVNNHRTLEPLRILLPWWWLQQAKIAYLSSRHFNCRSWRKKGSSRGWGKVKSFRGSLYFFFPGHFPRFPFLGFLILKKWIAKVFYEDILEQKNYIPNRRQVLKKRLGLREKDSKVAWPPWESNNI